MSDTKQNNKIDPCIWLDDAPDKHEGGWRNLYFGTDGTSKLGKNVYTSEQAAINASNESFHRTSLKPNSYWPGWGIKKLWTEISHAIQIPVKEKP